VSVKLTKYYTAAVWMEALTLHYTATIFVYYYFWFVFNWPSFPELPQIRPVSHRGFVEPDFF